MRLPQRLIVATTAPARPALHTQADTSGQQQICVLYTHARAPHSREARARGSTVHLTSTHAPPSHAPCCINRHGAPPQKGADALAVPAVPLYDSDDETTDSAVISALASRFSGPSLHIQQQHRSDASTSLTFCDQAIFWAPNLTCHHAVCLSFLPRPQ